MTESNNTNSKKYIKVSKYSGCVSANYNIIEEDQESIIIPYQNNETSGRFEFKQRRG